MGKGKQQQVIVTKQRKKTGTAGTGFNIIMTVFTGGLWLIIPFMQWLTHLLGPRQKTKTVVYGAPEQPQWQQPYYPPQQGYYPPPQAPYPPQLPYGYPPQQAPAQPWPQQLPMPPQQQWPTQPQPEWGPPPGWQQPPQG